MPRRWYVALSCLPFLLISIHHASAGSALSVDESSSRMRFGEERTEVLLAVESPSDQDFTARVHIELLDPNGAVRASAESEEHVRPGSNKLRLRLPLALSGFDSRGNFLWHRLRYRLTPLSPATGAGATEGVVSVSEITPDVFELQVAGTSYAVEGMRYRARVQARHPVSALPAKGVKLEAVARIEDGGDEDIHTFRASATTDREGFAAFDFDLPRDARSDELDIEIKGRLGEFEQEASDEIDFQHVAYTVVQTDKPIYQPGQTLHVRALLLDTFAQRAVSGEQVVFEISDPEGTTVFRAESRTTRFGIASADWAVAENMRLGDYRINVKVEGGRYDDTEAEQRVRVSRYELPNFSVKVKPDRDYYLPGESAEVTVSADYLFGQPVRRGRVRVVRETEREWNYREQKWETREDETFEGETDAEGRFVARINLAEAHQNLGGEGGSRPFNDLSYAAYFTDPTTNRTEQRRFDLRATREAIHVYVVKDDADVAAGAPLRFYVTTFYADGKPAECDVSIYQETATLEIASVAGARVGFGEVRRKPLPQVFHTNRLGAAKVSALYLPSGEMRDGNVSLHFRARDREGRTGARTENFGLEERTLVRVETDKAIYRPGEPLKVRLTSNREELLAAVDVWREGSVVHSATVRLRGGEALLRIPYGKNFSGKLVVRAQALPLSDSYRHPADARAVIYPRERELQFDVRLGKEEYRPGEEASAEVRVRTADGREVESALGVVVTDRAVDERARTDQEFGRRFNYDFMGGLLGTGESFAGITRRDLDHLDVSKSLPRELDLAAEMILNKNSEPPVTIFGDEFGTDQKALFDSSNKRTLTPLRRALEASYKKSEGDYPTGAENLRRALSSEGVDFDALRDPWGVPYAVRFGVSVDKDFLEVVSAAADKRAGTADDFVADRYEWPYFRKTGEKIERTLKEFHAQTGGFVRDHQTLEEALRREGLDLRNMRDRWGNLYEVSPDVQGRFFTIQFRSAGPDGRFYTNRHYSSDDFIVWTTRTDYFGNTEKRIAAALDRHLDAGGGFPKTEGELREVLRRARIGDSLLLDPWGKPYRITFDERAFGGGRVTLRTYPRHGGRSDATAEKLATKHKLHVVTLRSHGKDTLPDTWDDQYISSLSRVQSEQDESASKLKAGQATGPTVAATQGMIAGTVVDPNGAAVLGVSVKLTNKGTGVAHSTVTNDEGFFAADGLSAGSYEISITHNGFVTLLITDVTVQLASVTEINAWLDVGAVTETVEVTSDVIRVETSMTAAQIQDLPAMSRNGFSLLSRSNNFLLDGSDSRAINGQRARLMNIVTRSGGQNSTPRLREYFPETLFWQPSIETDASGRALINFKLADNITTWKMALVGSTADGDIGLFEREIRAFQPFFMEHDPPRVLTEGDEISLPVVLRNYLDKPQAVELEIKPESWFTLLGPARKRAQVAAGDAARETFDFRASASVKDGKQRVTAVASDESDAVEKKVSVHPDGAEITDTQGQVFGERGTLDVEIPVSTIAGTARAELKIYPNLLTHVVEGVEGIMKRPYGCGEQTVSSTYPSLLILRHYKQTGGELPPIAHKAEEYVRAGYERLLGYQTASGGFTYWGRGEPDFALTVYALRFLKEASEFVPVDESVIGGASRWLIQKQRADGAWPAHTWDRREEARRTIMLTAYIARVLASPAGKARETSAPVSSSTSDEAKALARAHAFLAPRVEKSEDPYTLASYALAAEGFGDRAAAGNASRRLASLALPEKDGAYWEANQETPFHGWGLTGRIETTALALRALAREGSAYETQISAGLLYLLKNKDRHGVWYSTQATVNVLDTLIAFASDPATAASAETKNSAVTAPGQTSNAHAEIYVNGRHAAKIEMPPAGRLGAPLTVDLTPFVSAPGANRIEIQRSAGATRAAAQVVANYYVPWADNASGTRHNKVAPAHVPSLKVTFDRTEGAPTEEIACAVEVARAPSGGYGMMLAEVGLPPGAEVDRASLERAIKEPESGLNRYDVLPDRIIAYVWPSYGTQTVRFTFKFRPRYGINALTAPSQVYDYYNPEAHAVVAPTRFVIR